MKKISYSVLRTLSFLSVAALVTGLAATLSAQNNNLLTVRVIEVQGGKTGEFVELQRQFTEARKKAGAPGRSIWQEVRGNTNTFHIVTSTDSLASLDETADPVMSDAAWATWISRIGPITKNRQVYTVQTYPELALPSKDGYEPNLITLTSRTVGSGRVNEYLDWLENKLHPVLKKAGVKGRSVGRTMHGGSTRVFTSVQHFATWADMEGPGPFAGLSDQERAALFEGNAGRVIDVETVVLRYRADLSHEGP